MPYVFARVELRGEPSQADYNKLHAHLKAKNWFQYLPNHTNHPMPHAMYQASYTNKPRLGEIAKILKESIETNVWSKAIVLLIEEADWAQSGG
jgi:hypothetical protein